MDNEQQRQSAYVMDALQNHHWLIQKDGAGEIASKPPLYTWLAAGTSALWPHINRLGVCLPACCATTLLACIVFLAGATFGPTAGFLASIVYLLSMPVLRQIGMARMDALFPLTTTWGALAAYSAWVRGRGWVWFWLACAAATLTKGPLGVLLAGAGLMAAFWEWGSGRPSRLRGHWLISSLVFLALSGGWFAAACAQWGRAVYNKLITEELVPQAVHIAGMPTAHGYDSPWSFITRFAPWSLLCCVGLWRVIFRPAQDLGQRRFERFVFCWLMLGMVFFAAAPHQRADLLLPLYPPAAMLAGRELALLLARLPRAGRW
jgi:4-amino-4-deoxy-L-arabinose transferase-like glycosyltransferase